MKKIISICLLGIVAGLSFPSCSQDLLEIEQKGVLSVDAVYGGADDETAESLIASVYRTLWSGVYGTPMYMGLAFPDGDHLCGGGSYSDGGTLRYTYNYALTPSTGYHIDEYTSIYRVIYWSNMIVEKLNNEDNSAVKNRVIAEAKFSRALALMWAIRIWGTPPFMPTTDTENPANGDPAEMWKWVEDNFSEAADVLPSKSGMGGQEEIGGRATREAALAYLGKAQLLQGKYAEASGTLQLVRDSGLYGLLPDFVSVTKAESDWSSENVFEYNVYNDPSSFSTQNDMRCMYLGVRSSFLNIASDGFTTGWGYSTPSPEFVEFMKEHEKTGDGSYSSRYEGTICSYDDYQKKPGANGLAASPWIDNIGYIGMKYYFWSSDLIPGSEAGAPRNARWHKNWVFLRYSEVLLDLAEAEAWLGNTGGVGLDALNEVRERAGLEPLGSMGKEDVKNERRAELWGENGDRYLNLIRWGDAPDVLGEVGRYRYDFYAPTRSTVTDGDSDYPVFATIEEGEASGRNTYIVKYADPVYGQSSGFVSGRDEYWPFPESEILSNPSLTQNPGWLK